ncbi:PAS domain-containing protein [Actinomycetospora sp. TBRC 11914]|uniref:PAS domain-containing protein n=1 Tax=Actinomycetospora sp. TBRC 11914 TaxID=2729387 RepID=UPI00145CD4BA|nr:PAS domain-containing protein [Actinomycetospora sp. TBRC 11914]NMO88451.1 PAS domain-containing protein [Actinomycetospora sp. TBRC 11914]
MITDRDLDPIPEQTARALVRAARQDVAEELLHELSARSLGEVMHVVLRLTAVASTLDPHRRDVLLDLCEELDGAIRAARQVVVGRTRAAALPHAPGEAADDGEIALLDSDGVIVWTNPAWDAFCLANGGDPRAAGVGCSYLAACDAGGDEPSAEVGRAIRAAIRGQLRTPVRIVVPCAAPDRPRAFDVVVSTRRADTGEVLGATVTLTEARNTPAELSSRTVATGG